MRLPRNREKGLTAECTDLRKGIQFRSELLRRWGLSAGRNLFRWRGLSLLSLEGPEQKDLWFSSMSRFGHSRRRRKDVRRQWNSRGLARYVHHGKSGLLVRQSGVRLPGPDSWRMVGERTSCCLSNGSTLVVRTKRLPFHSINNGMIGLVSSVGFAATGACGCKTM